MVYSFRWIWGFSRAKIQDSYFPQIPEMGHKTVPGKISVIVEYSGLQALSTASPFSQGQRNRACRGLRSRLFTPRSIQEAVSVWTQEQRSIQNDKGRWGVDYDHNQVLQPGGWGTLEYISNRRKVLHSLEFTAITPQREKSVFVTETRMAMYDWLHLINGWPPSNYKTWCWQVLIGWHETC